MAALEAKNEATETENSNLRDLLSRLQQENLALKQAQFTFSVPKPPQVSTSAATSTVQQSPFSFFNHVSSFPPVAGPSQLSPKPPAFDGETDWSSLTTFDPSMLSILDEPLEVPMRTDHSNSPYGQYALPQSYKTIANNPLLMSFVDETPSLATTNTTTANSFEPFNFNFTSLTNPWTSTAQSLPFNQTHTQSDFSHTNPNHSLDELFGGNYMGNQGPLDFSALIDSTSMSPVVHGNGGKSASPQGSASSQPSNSTNSTSPTSASTSNGQSPFWATMSRSAESPPSASESTPSSATATRRPGFLTREDVAKHIEEEGQSPFTNPATPTVHKATDFNAGNIIACKGSNFPKTKESPDNIEVLKAWRCITQHPHFKVCFFPGVVVFGAFKLNRSTRMLILTNCVRSSRRKLGVMAPRSCWSQRRCVTSSRLSSRNSSNNQSNIFHSRSSI
jgi:AP-1-like factor